MKPEIVTAKVDHISHIAQHMRLSDVDELQALYDMSSHEVLIQSFKMSCMAWTGLIDGVPVCMFGVVRAGESIGRPWMIGTVDLDRFSMIFLRRCRPQVETMQSSFALLENYVDARNTKAIEWLKWLGFSFDEPEPMGPLGLPFYRFTRGEG